MSSSVYQEYDNHAKEIDIFRKQIKYINLSLDILLDSNDRIRK